MLVHILVDIFLLYFQCFFQPILFHKTYTISPDVHQQLRPQIDALKDIEPILKYLEGLSWGADGYVDYEGYVQVDYPQWMFDEGLISQEEINAKKKKSFNQRLMFEYEYERRLKKLEEEGEGGFVREEEDAEKQAA